MLLSTPTACVCADQAHSSVERAGLLGGVKLRLLAADENLRLRGETLERAIQEDRDKGLIPFYVSTASTDFLGLVLLCEFMYTAIYVAKCILFNVVRAFAPIFHLPKM